MGTSGSLADALFSKVRQRVLGIFFARPSERYQLSQIIALANSGRGAVQRELESLARAGIVSQSLIDGRKLYEANRQSPIFDELHGIILKTTGLLEPLTKALQPLAQELEVAFVYGSVARGEDTARSDIDLMIVSENLGHAEVYDALSRAEKRLHRTINPNIMSPREWQQKLLGKNSFIGRISQQPKLFVFGSDDELTRIGQSG